LPNLPSQGLMTKNARLFTLTLLLTITIFAKINLALKYKIFLRITSRNITNLS